MRSAHVFEYMDRKQCGREPATGGVKTSRQSHKDTVLGAAASRMGCEDGKQATSKARC